MNSNNYYIFSVHRDSSGILTRIYPKMRVDDVDFTPMLHRLKRMIDRDKNPSTFKYHHIFKVTENISCVITLAQYSVSARILCDNHVTLRSEKFCIFGLRTPPNDCDSSIYAKIKEIGDFLMSEPKNPFSDEEIESELIEFFVDYMDFDLEELVDEKSLALL